MSDSVHDPNRRQRYTFRRDGDDLILDVSVEPGGDVPSHRHPALEERFTVVEGRVRFKADGRKVVGGPGEEVLVPAGAKHSFKNVGDAEARLRVEVRPALELQEFLEDMAEASRARLYTRRGVPTSPRGLARVAQILERYRETVVVSWPPPLAQRLLMAPLARLYRGRA